MAQFDGILPILKPAGLTSHDVIYKLRKITGQKKIGHTGTLDPLATGLMLILMGRATKLTQFLIDWDKTYRAELTLGAISDTLDKDGNIEPVGEIPQIDERLCSKIIEKFTGLIDQRVPAISAVKVKGKRLYEWTRSGTVEERPVRTIEIKKLDIIAYHKPVMAIEVFCSKGTYIRTLADDIGRLLGCGAYISALERIHVGPFPLESALTIEDVSRLNEEGTLISKIRPMQDVLPFPEIRINAEAADLVRHGRHPMAGEITEFKGIFNAGDLVSVADNRGRILAIARSKSATNLLKEKPGEDHFSFVRVLV